MNEELLLTILALQNGFISTTDFAEISSAWINNLNPNLRSQLKEKIDSKNLSLLDRLASSLLKKNENNLEKAFSSIGAYETMHKTLGGEYAISDGTLIKIIIEEDELDVYDIDLKVTKDEWEKYRIISEKGRGGMGRVLLAFDENIGRNIALKELLPEHIKDNIPKKSSTVIINRFLREARITGQLEHPAISPVYEIGRKEDNTYYYTMKLIKGKTLSHVLNEKTSLSARLKLLIHFMDVCNAVAYAHSRNVIHRDIKSANIMIGEFGETILIDWGLAKIDRMKDGVESDILEGLQLIAESGMGKTISGKAVGTPEYMSPEQAIGNIAEIDKISDVYSLGAVLYEILTGETPYKGNSPKEVMHRVIKEKYTPVCKKLEQVPPELAAIAEKALSRKKKDRYGKASDLVNEIEAYLSGKKVSVYHYSSFELLKRFAEKNKPAALAITTVFFTLIASFILIHLSFIEERKMRRFADRQRVIAEKREGDASYYMSQALVKEAESLLKEKRINEASIYAAASLMHNPEIQMKNQKGKELSKYIQSTYLRAVARTVLYKGKTAPMFSHKFSASHGDTATNCSFSEDGKLFTTAGYDGNINIWYSSGQKIANVGKHKGIAWKSVFVRLNCSDKNSFFNTPCSYFFICTA